MERLKRLLEDELQRSLREQADREKALAALPKGVLVRKYIKGRQYYYLMTREGGKVRFEYKGKLFGQEIRLFEKIKSDRALLRNRLAEGRRRTAFLRRMLRSREMRGAA